MILKVAGFPHFLIDLTILHTFWVGGSVSKISYFIAY